MDFKVVIFQQFSNSNLDFSKYISAQKKKNKKPNRVEPLKRELELGAVGVSSRLGGVEPHLITFEPLELTA